jgi:hypothetical protein
MLQYTHRIIIKRRARELQFSASASKRMTVDELVAYGRKRAQHTL